MYLNFRGKTSTAIEDKFQGLHICIDVSTIIEIMTLELFINIVVLHDIYW